MQVYRHKARSKRFIKYSESNDEPEDHVLGKQRIRGILSQYSFKIIVNTEKHEYLLPIFHNTIGDINRQYQLDVFAYNPHVNYFVAVEVDGLSHKASKDSLKKEIVTNLFETHPNVLVEDKLVRMKRYKYVNFTSEELIGKNAMSVENIEKRMLTF